MSPPRLPVARAVGVLGEVLITLGLVLGLFVTYELWWTGQQTAQAQDRLADRLTDEFAAATQVPQPSDDPVVAPIDPADEGEGGGEPAEEVRAGDGIAVLRIPRLGFDWSWVVVEGVARNDLKQGPGHYPETALPGEVGNFAVAGHRRTYGQPFVDLDRLEPGDLVIVETAGGWVTYETDSSEVVLPDETGVVLPVPKQPSAQPTDRLFTLTTCWPKNGSSKRLVVYGHQVEERSRDQGPPPGLEG